MSNERARCPHGAPLIRMGWTSSHPGSTYSDGCWSTSPNGPRRFWCGSGEAWKTFGISITEGEYLAAWDEAMILNAGDDLYDEAENEDYIRTIEANDHADYVRFMDEHAEYLGEVPWSDRVDDDPWYESEAYVEHCRWTDEAEALTFRNNEGRL